MLWIIAIYLSACFGSTFQAPICMPTISEGSTSYPNIDGYVYFDCEISTCPNISKIVFEKTGLSPTWTPIYEGVNKTQYKALDTATEYTLENRNEYAAFRTKHTLDIDPLILQDHGKWRCVVYDANFRKYESGPLDFIIYVLPVDGAFYIKPNSSDLVTNQQQEFTCVADGVYPEPDMFWEVNGVKDNGLLSMQQHENTFWFVNNTIQIRFDTLGINTLKCVIQAGGRDPLLEKHIDITLQEPAIVLYPQHDILLTVEVDATFSLGCRGSGYHPRIIWYRDGDIIHVNDTNYNIKEEWDYSKCDGSISSIYMDPAMACKDEDQYTGAYTCIITLEPPYQSSEISSNMNVTMSRGQCKEKNTGQIVGFSMLCLILIAVGIGFLVYRKKQKKLTGELQHDVEQGEQLLVKKIGEQLREKEREKEYPKLTIIDSPDGSYTTDDSKPVAGSVCWFSGEHIAVASNTSNEIKLATVQGDVQIDSLVNNHFDMRGINAGFMLTEEDTEKNIKEEHIIIYVTTDGKQKMIVATFDKKNKTWSQRSDLTNSIENPLTICEINNECFGVLRGNPNTHEDVTIEVCTREAIRQLVKGESNKKKAIGNSFSPIQVPSESAMEQDNTSTPLQTQLVIRVNYAKQTQISCRDQLCYARTKFYILSFHESTVYQVNVDGNIESFRNSFGSQPVSLLRGPDGTIDVTCCDAVYTGVFGQNRRLADCYTKWSAVDHTIVVANGSGTLSLIPFCDGEKEEITLDPTTPLCSGVFNIICGLMLSEDEHIIIYTIDGQQKIAAIKLDKENKSWSQIIDMTNTIVHPLAMCNIDKDSVGVLRGTPGAKQDITIEKYAIKKFINKISKSLPGTMKTQMSAEQTISVTISQPSKINFRDQIYHSQNKFFILSFDQSTLHVINDGGKLLKSGAFAFLKGPIGSRHIACCNKSFRDYVAPEHIYIKKIRVASTASYMLNVSGKAFVADDPGLPHSSCALIPMFQPDSLKFHKTIEGFSSIMQQCVWSTNKSGVVAVGSAESCHISLVSGSKDSPVSVFMDEIQRPAKILQGIHLGDRTHLVMFQATPRVNILKYVRINPNNDKINIIGDVKPWENNTKEVEEVPVAVFAIDKVTFGIVYSINERYVEIKIYKRETNNAIKEIDQEELETDLGHGKTDQGGNVTGQGDEESNNEVDQRNRETDHGDQEAVQRNGGAEQENGITDQIHEKVDEGDEEINQGNMETIVINGDKIRLAKTVKLIQNCVGNNNDSACVDKNGKFYISNYSQREVNSFDVNGLWIKKYEILLDGITLAPYRVMVDKENQVFILCQEAIYRLNSSEVFNFEAKFRLYSKQALEPLDGDQVKTVYMSEPKQSWDICFDGNLMYSVYEDTLDVYGP